eukprot:g22786.t1
MPARHSDDDISSYFASSTLVPPVAFSAASKRSPSLLVFMVIFASPAFVPFDSVQTPYPCLSSFNLKNAISLGWFKHIYILIGDQDYISFLLLSLAIAQIPKALAPYTLHLKERSLRSHLEAR